jgi:hypothetical protein
LFKALQRAASSSKLHSMLNSPLLFLNMFIFHQLQSFRKGQSLGAVFNTKAAVHWDNNKKSSFCGSNLTYSNHRSFDFFTDEPVHKNTALKSLNPRWSWLGIVVQLTIYRSKSCSTINSIGIVDNKGTSRCAPEVFFSRSTSSIHRSSHYRLDIGFELSRCGYTRRRWHYFGHFSDGLPSSHGIKQILSTQ